MKTMKKTFSLAIIFTMLATAFAFYPSKIASADLEEVERVWWCLNDGTTKTAKISNDKITMKGTLYFDLTTPTGEWPATTKYKDKKKSFTLTDKTKYKVSKNGKMVSISKNQFEKKHLKHFMNNKKGYKTLLVYLNEDDGTVRKVSISKKARKERKGYDD